MTTDTLHTHLWFSTNKYYYERYNPDFKYLVCTYPEDDDED